MRLVRRKIYRAFPELDRFSDQQCREYLRAATASWSRRLVRVVVVTAMMVLLVVIGVIIAVYLGMRVADQLRLREEEALLVFGAFLIPALLVTGSLGLLCRDAILRWRIRTLIRTCGSCPDCGYTLLGMPVDDRDAVRCPECGRVVEASRANGDVVEDAKGVRVYLPHVASVDPSAAARRERRHRRFFKLAAMAAATIGLVAGMAFVYWRWSVSKQVSLAKSERLTTERIATARIASWPSGIVSGSAERWDEYLALTKEIGQVDVAKYPEGLHSLSFDPTLLELTGSQAAAAPKGPGNVSRERSREYTIDVLKSAEAAGVFERLKAIRWTYPLRPLDVPEGGTLFDITINGTSESRRAVQACIARMIVARQEGALNTYADSVETGIWVSDLQSRQGFLIDSMVGDAALHSLVRQVMDDTSRWPSHEWASGVQEVLLQHIQRARLSDAWEFERIATLDAIQHFFSDTTRIQKATVGMGTADYFGMRLTPGSVGTYEGNRDAVNRVFDAWIAYARDVEDGKAATPPSIAPSGLAMVDVLLPSFTRIASSTIALQSELRRCLITLECMKIRTETGDWPASLEVVTKRLGPNVPMIDPSSGLPFRLATAHERQVVNLPQGLVRSDPAPDETPGPDPNDGSPRKLPTLAP